MCAAARRLWPPRPEPSRQPSRESLPLCRLEVSGAHEPFEQMAEAGVEDMQMTRQFDVVDRLEPVNCELALRLSGAYARVDAVPMFALDYGDVTLHVRPVDPAHPAGFRARGTTLPVEERERMRSSRIVLTPDVTAIAGGVYWATSSERSFARSSE